MEKLAEAVRECGILSIEEVRTLFLTPWPDPMHQAINLLSATTGMRLGECLGLKGEDIHDDYIHICHNYQHADGVKAPKWGSIRDVPLPVMTHRALEALASTNPHGNGFIFWSRDPKRPMSSRTAINGLIAALKRIGISNEERMRRGIHFHSWRHWYNSMLRGRVEDHALRALTGHKAEAMTERYSHVTEEQRAAVLRLAGKLIDEDQ